VVCIRAVNHSVDGKPSLHLTFSSILVDFPTNSKLQSNFTFSIPITSFHPLIPSRKMKFTTTLLLAFSAPLATALPNPVADMTPEFSSDLQRRGDYQIAVRYVMEIMHSQNSTDSKFEGLQEGHERLCFYEREDRVRSGNTCETSLYTLWN
jgi:hypothetical protein